MGKFQAPLQESLFFQLQLLMLEVSHFICPLKIPPLKDNTTKLLFTPPPKCTSRNHIFNIFSSQKCVKWRFFALFLLLSIWLCVIIIS